MRVLVRLRGGLGNQLFQYATGRAMALESGGLLELDPRALIGQHGHENFGLGAFQIEAPMCAEWRLPGDGINPSARLRVPKFLRRYHRLKDFEGPLDPADIIQRGNVWLQGTFQSVAFFEKHSDRIRREFRFAADPSEAVSMWLDRITSSRTPVSLHVRRGDYLPDVCPIPCQATCGIGYFQAAIARLAQDAPDLTVFVFSDDPGWVRDNLRFEQKTEYVTGNQPHEDMRLMAACQHNVIANSTFSWWGAWLNPHPDKQVIAPDRWLYIPSDTALRILPDDWIRLPIEDPYRAGPQRPS